MKERGEKPEERDCLEEEDGPAVAAADEEDGSCWWWELVSGCGMAVGEAILEDRFC